MSSLDRLGGLLKMGWDLLMPPPPSDSFTEFKQACSTIISVLKSKAVDQKDSLIKAFNLVSASLRSEIDQNTSPFFDYFVENQIMQKITDSLEKGDLHSEHIHPILRFLLSFVNTDMSRFFFHMAVHEPYSVILKRLDYIYLKCPEHTKNFVQSLWEECLKSKVIIDMLSISKDGETTYPLIDFYIDSIQLNDDMGTISRQNMLSIIAQEKMGQREGHTHLSQYIISKLFVFFNEFLAEIITFPNTIIFEGIIVALINWSDQIFLVTDFPCHNLILKINELNQIQQYDAVRFIISIYSKSTFSNSFLGFYLNPQFLSSLIPFLKSSDQDKVTSSLLLYESFLLWEQSFQLVFPPIEKSGFVDILTFIPPNWIENNQISTSESPKRTRSRKIIKAPFDRTHCTTRVYYAAILELFSKFSELPDENCIIILRVLEKIFNSGNDLIDDEFVKRFKTIITQIQKFEEELSAAGADAENIKNRISMLVKFANNVHEIIPRDNS